MTDVSVVSQHQMQLHSIVQVVLETKHRNKWTEHISLMQGFNFMQKMGSNYLGVQKRSILYIFMLYYVTCTCWLRINSEFSEHSIANFSFHIFFTSLATITFLWMTLYHVILTYNVGLLLTHLRVGDEYLSYIFCGIL
jgi:hypothetical protein